ncbi:MAG: phosphohistidine phosphatase SixA [Gammaproteobacteria bacterium]|nr:phosphohistidine phosphatase SixA [Gammaproteobacteria bacterium]
MQIYLVQHGESVAKEINPDRPLSLQGKQDVTRIADFLKNAGITVNRILHSGKTRARQTAEILAEDLSGNMKVSAISGIDPNDPVDQLSAQIRTWTEDTLVVGHLPFMAKLVAQLVLNNDANVPAAFQPGSVVCLARDENGAWKIQWMLRPELFLNKNKS